MRLADSTSRAKRTYRWLAPCSWFPTTSLTWTRSPSVTRRPAVLSSWRKPNCSKTGYWGFSSEAWTPSPFGAASPIEQHSGRRWPCWGRGEPSYDGRYRRHAGHVRQQALPPHLPALDQEATGGVPCSDCMNAMTANGTVSDDLHGHQDAEIIRCFFTDGAQDTWSQRLRKF